MNNQFGTGMGDLLAKAGLIDQEDHARSKQIQEFQDQESVRQDQRETSNEATLTDLDKANSVKEFKYLSKLLLFKNPELVKEVVQRAHRFKGAEGSKDLIGLMYAIRDELPRINSSERIEYLKRALRSAGRTTKPKR